ncbi:MAG: hypothetical protein WC533_01950 [Candidatus Pacearchaeota archaeon]
MKSRLNLNLSWRGYDEFSKWLRNEFNGTIYQPIAKKCINIPFEGDSQLEFLFPLKEPKPDISSYSGSFFEYLTAAIFGGYLHQGRMFKLKGGRSSLQPDVSDHRKRIYYETKSCVQRDQLKLIREQMEKMRQWQIYDNKRPFPKIYFVLFRHKVTKMKNRGITQNQFLHEARKGVLYAIHAPFSIMLQFYINPTATNKYLLNEYCYSEIRRDPNSGGYARRHVRSISGTFLNDLMVDPKATVESIGLCPDDYNFERRKVRGLVVNNQRVHSFPLWFISHRNYCDWVEKHRELLEEKLIEGLEVQDELLPLFSKSDLPVGDRNYLPDNTSRITQKKEKEKMLDEDDCFPWEHEEQVDDGKPQESIF